MTQKFKSNVRFDADVTVQGQTATTVPYLDSNKKLTSSAVTPTELGHLSGVTSAIQTQLGNKVETSALGSTVATLVGGKVPVSQLPNAIMEYQGTWNAATNTPTLANGAGNADEAIGNVYRVSAAGSVDFGAGSISFEVGDYVILNASKIFEKADMTDGVVSVNGASGIVVLGTDDISEGVTNLYFTDERAQDAVGTILADSSSINFTYTDATPEITAVVLPAGVDHDSLQNFVANEHIDHTSVSISGASNGGLSGGGDISASRTLSVDITNATAETTVDNADLILIYDNSATALRKMTRANFLAGQPVSSVGDINESSFSANNNQAVAANVTGLAFAAGTVRSFKALVSVAIDATSDLFETFELIGVQKTAGFEMAVSAVGDDSGVVFTITSGGQVQYTSSNISGFVANTIKFRAIVTGV
jgi:hypothetical protein